MMSRKEQAKQLVDILHQNGLYYVDSYCGGTTSFDCTDGWYCIDLLNNRGSSCGTFVMEGKPAEFFLTGKHSKAFAYDRWALVKRKTVENVAETIIELLEMKDARPSTKIRADHWFKYRPKQLDLTGCSLSRLMLINEMKSTSQEEMI